MYLTHHLQNGAGAGIGCSGLGVDFWYPMVPERISFSSHMAI